MMLLSFQSSCETIDNGNTYSVMTGVYLIGLDIYEGEQRLLNEVSVSFTFYRQQASCDWGSTFYLPSAKESSSGIKAHWGL